MTRDTDTIALGIKNKTKLALRNCTVEQVRTLLDNKLERRLSNPEN